MKNADLFKDTFGTYATEIWSMPENDFLKWLNEDEVLEQEPILDRIRAEIDSYCSDNRDRNDGLYIAMRIIDKYRQEG